MRSARRPWKLAVYDFCAGTDTRAYEWLGVHRAGDGKYHFRLFAPQAQEMMLCGDFLHKGACHMTRSAEGIWSVTVSPEIIAEGMRYGYLPQGGTVLLSDPFARRAAADAGAETVSLIETETSFVWRDEKWMRTRGGMAQGPINLYQIHLSSFVTRGGQSCVSTDAYLNYRELGEIMARYVKDMGYTHIRLMPLCEHTRDEAYGYAAESLFAPTARHGTPDDLRAMIDCLHRGGIGVVMDLPMGRDAEAMFAIGQSDGVGVCHPVMQSICLSAALFWLREYHFDGICPIGAGLWSLDFRRRFCATVHGSVPDALLLGEGDVSEEDGFDAVMHEHFGGDTLDAIGVLLPRWQPLRDRLTLTLREATEFDRTVLLSLYSPTAFGGGSNPVIMRFGGGYLRRFDAARLALSYLMAHPGKKQLFMGGELGQSRPWDGTVPPDWFLRELPPHAALAEYVRTLNHFYRCEPRLWVREQAQMQEIAPTVLMLRRGGAGERALLILLNFGDEPREITLFAERGLRILLHSDRKEFGGEGRIEDRTEAQEELVCLLLPPLTAVFCEEDDGEVPPARAFVLPPR